MLIINILNKIKEFFNSKNNMVKVTSFKEPNKDNQEEVINFLMNYKKQNPQKFEQKKEALYKQFGLTTENESKIDPPKDETDLELEAMKTKAKKK